MIVNVALADNSNSKPLWDPVALAPPTGTVAAAPSPNSRGMIAACLVLPESRRGCCASFIPSEEQADIAGEAAWEFEDARGEVETLGLQLAFPPPVDFGGLTTEGLR